MLVLARKANESIHIGDSIEVTILAIEGDRVKVGIRAPREALILRGEIFEATQEQARIQQRLAGEEEAPNLETLRQLLAAEAESHPQEAPRQ